MAAELHLDRLEPERFQHPGPEIPWWITVVIIAREAGVTLLRFLVIRHGVIP
ncbi:CDP-alcohol phosphatidyltransferase family protein, partial [Microbispora rosea]